MEPDLIAIGVDGAPGGWIAACLDGEGSTSLRLFRDIGELAAARGQAIVAIDMPIGLTEGGGHRPCDREARRRLGALTSSVFAAPARYLLGAAGDYPAMRALVAERKALESATPSVSAQAAALAHKIAELDTFARANPGCETWLFECHPELSFLALAGEPLADKRSPAGALTRLRLVESRFPDAGEQLRLAPWRGARVTFADALDAYAALATACAIRAGRSEALGDGVPDGEGLPMRIVVQAREC